MALYPANQQWDYDLYEQGVKDVQPSWLSRIKDDGEHSGTRYSDPRYNDKYAVSRQKLLMQGTEPRHNDLRYSDMTDTMRI